ncbi:MAG: hypothetical protein ACWA44_04085 [Thiotrichales bacterium]
MAHKSAKELDWARKLLLRQDVPSEQISRVNTTGREGAIALTDQSLADYFKNYHVPQSNIDGYLSVLETGASLLIVTGSYPLIEMVGSALESLKGGFVSVHYN